MGVVSKQHVRRPPGVHLRVHTTTKQFCRRGVGLTRCNSRQGCHQCDEGASSLTEDGGGGGGGGGEGKHRLMWERL